ncbi:MAG TPA: TIGR00282 family metallophosphoesterase [Synergistaceae bacterium]|nr:TIGR00282 family metallophosphoesterase [Synergistaceae bacterium]HQF91619.1 TIGR00282 family metallophosphoesterase [Synergistaceae bacterium]HQH78302.1 TIGR00282 family metallophosphoesterase [Synergistaceae bacterium]HQK24749.1 TIGR00282 family metallophosphoesterase [Synergistaceae bacterium]
MRLLFVGDVVGRPGREALARALPELRQQEGPFDFVLANGENAAAGFGLTEKVMNDLFSLGVACLTGGNHIWDKKEFIPVLGGESRVLRPANYPPGCPGHGVAHLSNGRSRLAVVSLQGRAFMPPVDCPFRAADAIIEALEERAVLVDFHAEATSEKWALFRHLDGRVSAVVGTHTHVATADEEVLPGGTAVLTDVGMTGGHGGVIGMTTETTLCRFLDALPSKFAVCDTDLRLRGAVIDIDDETGRALAIRRVERRF